jgi:hypothetical protein
LFEKTEYSVEHYELALLMNRRLTECILFLTQKDKNYRNTVERYVWGFHNLPRAFLSIENPMNISVDEAIKYYDEIEQSGKKAVFLTDYEMAVQLGNRRILHLGKTGEEMASNLYDLLHEGEAYDCIITFKLSLNSELMLSVNNRFSKAFFQGGK